MYNLLFIGTARNGQVFKARYGSTAKMIAEAAIWLGQTDRADFAGGFRTPASAMGQRLIPRLIEHAGLTFQMVA